MPSAEELQTPQESQGRSSSRGDSRRRVALQQREQQQHQQQTAAQSGGALALSPQQTQPSATEKLYCYVDETGQDTKGQLFIVSVAIVADDSQREIALQRCTAIEHKTGKGRRKWTKTRHPQRASYIENILEEPLFQGQLYFSVYSESTDYLSL